MHNTENSKYDIGSEILSKLSDVVLEKLRSSLDDVAPDFVRVVVEFPFGQIYARDGLDLKQRELISITALATLGNAKIQFRECSNVHW